MKLLQLDIDHVVPDPANARRHGTKNLKAIEASLRRFGQQKPIVIDSNNVVRAGNGTLAAAKNLGWTSIGVVRSDLDGSDMVAFALADNRTSELAEWDFEVLSAVIKALEEEEEGRGDELGWSGHELENLLAADWSPPEPTGDLGDFTSTEFGGEESPSGSSESAETLTRLTITFTEDDLKKIDEVALLLSPDESIGRQKTIMSLVNRELDK